MHFMSTMGHMIIILVKDLVRVASWMMHWRLVMSSETVMWWIVTFLIVHVLEEMRVLMMIIVMFIVMVWFVTIMNLMVRVIEIRVRSSICLCNRMMVHFCIVMRLMSLVDMMCVWTFKVIFCAMMFIENSKVRFMTMMNWMSVIMFVIVVMFLFMTILSIHVPRLMAHSMFMVSINS